MPFQPGQSGNPAGRPAGSRNKSTREMEEAFAAGGPEAVRMILDHAKAANLAAMRLCMERALPMGKNRPLPISLPPIDTPDYIRAATTVVLEALGEGEIMIAEANGLMALIERTVRLQATREASKLAARVEFLEGALNELLVQLGVDPIVNNNGKTTPAPVARPTPAAAAPTQAASLAAGPSIVNNNAKTMAPAAAVQAPGARINGGARERLMSSTSPLAHPGGTTPGKATPAMPPHPPAAQASAA